MANNSCSVCTSVSPCVSCIAKAKHELCHLCDGPLTDFVLISRAMRLATSQKVAPVVVSNALFDALQEYGYLAEANDCDLLESDS